MIDPRRPARKYPGVWTLVCYWQDRDPCPFIVGTWTEANCFACQRPAPTNHENSLPRDNWNRALGWLERAHLVTRMYGGLDDPANVVPLCFTCHRIMPDFPPAEWEKAIKWVRGGGRYYPLLLPDVTASILRCPRPCRREAGDE
jgi:hypothetical protein